jgi:1,2-diacylglycerol 3-alpha-glucosyltransferase
MLTSQVKAKTKDRSSKPLHIAIIFVNIGNYHAARLQAADKICRQQGWQVTAIQMTNDTLEHPWGDCFSDLPMTVKTLIPVTANAPSLPRDRFSKAANQPLWEYLCQIKPDAILIPGWGFPISRTALRWCLRHQAAPILMSESNEYDYRRSWPIETYKRWLVSKYSSALVGGQGHKRYLIKLGMKPEAIAFGYNIVDNDSYKVDRQQSFQSPINKSYFLAIGRFVPPKNLLTLIQAYASYYKRSPNPWDLVLCGSGPQKEEIEELMKTLGLQSAIHLPGFLQQDSLITYFANAECFVHASVEEQWGLVVNEAMAAGLPVLVSDRCGCAEDLVIEGINGFTFDPTKIEQLTALMLRISSEEIDRQAMGQAALDHIQKFSPAYFANGLMQAIDYALTSQQKSLVPTL